MIFVNQEKVIEITADIPCRRHGREQIKLFPFGEGREDSGEHALLDLGSQVQFRADPLFFRCHVPETFRALHNPDLHGLNLPAELTKFICRPDLNPADLIGGIGSVLSGLELLRGPGERDDRLRHIAMQQPDTDNRCCRRQDQQIQDAPQQQPL